MKKNEIEFIDALRNYLNARSTLESMRERVLVNGFSDDALAELAQSIADIYQCKYHLTNEGGISFCDDLGSIKATRRDDARKFWRRTVLGLIQ